MTIFIFLGSLLAAMAIGVPIAYALLLSGVAFAVPAGLLLLAELLRTLTGRLRDDELVMVQESEDLAHAQAQMKAELKKDAPQ